MYKVIIKLDGMEKIFEFSDKQGFNQFVDALKRRDMNYRIIS